MGFEELHVHACCRHMPAVFKAVSPHYAVRFFMGDAKAAWVALGGVVLCISGSEALAADLGHFSRRAVTVRRAHACTPIWHAPRHLLPPGHLCCRLAISFAG
jgi:K+ transporter